MLSVVRFFVCCLLCIRAVFNIHLIFLLVATGDYLGATLIAAKTARLFAAIWSQRDIFRIAGDYLALNVRIMLKTMTKLTNRKLTNKKERNENKNR